MTGLVTVAAAAAAVWAATATAAESPRPEPARPDSLPASWTSERVQIEEPVKAGMPIRITNPIGNVQVRRVRDPRFVVFATVQRQDGTPVPEFRIRRSPVLGLTVEPPAAAAGTDAEPGTSTPRRAACRADLAVFVPDGSALQVETTQGSITVKGIRCDVEAATAGGAIEVFADGPVRAATRGGDITVIFRTAARWTHDMNLASETGNIAVRMPRPADSRVHIETGGDLTSDFTTRVRQPVDSRLKTADIRVADGESGSRGFWSRAGRRLLHPFRRTPRLTIRTEIGSVKVLRAPPGWLGVQEDLP